MKIERFYAYVTSLETGRDEIKKLIKDVKKSEKENAWYFKDITIELTGILFRRRMQFEKIESIKLINDQLNISYSANVHNETSVEVSDKDATIGIPIKLINMIKVEMH